MNPKLVAGVSGAACLAALGLLSIQNGSHSRARRDIVVEEDVITHNDFNGEDTIETFAEFLTDIHADPAMSSDVQLKFNWNKLKTQAGTASRFSHLEEAMREEHITRIEQADLWQQSTSDYWNSPAAYAGGGMCEWTNTPSEDECVDYSGFDKLAPGVAELMKNVSCSASHQSFAGAKNTAWFIIPRAVPLWITTTSESAHNAQWTNYFLFVSKLVENWQRNWPPGTEVRLSVGLYTAGLQLIPRGFKMNRNPPLRKLKKFYGRPAMTAAKPRLAPVLRTLNGLVRTVGSGNQLYADNSLSHQPMDGSRPSNCFAMIFIQDVPSDLNQLEKHSEEGNGPSDDIDALNKRCTVTYAFVMPNARSRDTATQRVISRMETILQPKRKEYTVRDPEFSGIWRLNNFDEVSSDAFYHGVMEYMCLLDKRALCRLKMKGKVAEPTDNTPTISSLADYNDYPGEEEVVEEILEDEAEDKSLEEVISEDYEEELDMTAEDACCGGSLYEGAAYNPICKMCESTGLTDNGICV